LLLGSRVNVLYHFFGKYKPGFLFLRINVLAFCESLAPFPCRYVVKLIVCVYLANISFEYQRCAKPEDVVADILKACMHYQWILSQMDSDSGTYMIWLVAMVFFS
jgi:hypothetical protein